MLRKNLSALLIVIFLNLNLYPVYAQEAVLLSDDELDQISAGGYSDGFLGSINNVINAPKAPSVPITVTSPKGPISVKTPFVTIAPKSVNASSTLNAPLTPNLPTSPNTPSTPVNPVIPNVATAPNVPNSPLSPINPTVPGLPNAPESPNVPVVPNSPLSPETPNLPVNPITPVSPVGPIAPVGPVQPVVPAVPDLPTLPVNPVAPTSPVSPEVPNVASTPAAPESPEDPFVLDAFVSGDGVAFKSSGGNSTQTDALKALALGNNSVNSVSVGETSQQNLSSLVNINAAGSVVPVQVNLTVIMNSTVGNVESNNILNLNSYSTF